LCRESTSNWPRPPPSTTFPVVKFLFRFLSFQLKHFRAGTEPSNWPEPPPHRSPQIVINDNFATHNSKVRNIWKWHGTLNYIQVQYQQ
jgi:hypothetical protein